MVRARWAGVALRLEVVGGVDPRLVELPAFLDGVLVKYLVDGRKKEDDVRFDQPV